MASWCLLLNCKVTDRLRRPDGALSPSSGRLSPPHPRKRCQEREAAFFWKTWKWLQRKGPQAPWSLIFSQMGLSLAKTQEARKEGWREDGYLSTSLGDVVPRSGATPTRLPTLWLVPWFSAPHATYIPIGLKQVWIGVFTHLVGTPGTWLPLRTAQGCSLDVKSA